MQDRQGELDQRARDAEHGRMWDERQAEIDAAADRAGMTPDEYERAQDTATEAYFTRTSPTVHQIDVPAADDAHEDDDAYGM